MGLPDLAIEGAVATITLRRPERANRLEPDDLEALDRHVKAVNANEQVLVLRLQSSGKYFCSGYDIDQFGSDRPVDFEGVVNALEDARPVTIALLQGGVYGGATDFALACDFRLGTRAVDMFMPAARLGLHFYPRGMQRYVSRLGVDAAKRLFLTAQKIDADEMRSIGFLTQLVDTEAALQGAAVALTDTLRGMAPLALLGMKKHLNRIARGTFDESDARVDAARAAASQDMVEGRLAWAEKRAAKFSGR